MLFFFKKAIAPLLYPLALCSVLLVLGLALLWLTRKQKVGRLIVTTGVTLLLLFGYGFGTSALLQSIERKYPPAAVTTPTNAAVKWVVVLGGGATADPDVPITGRLSEASLARLVEGIRLHRQLRESKLILSSGSVFRPGSDAEDMRNLATQLGVAPDRVLLDDASPDTETQAQHLSSLVGQESFYLVTSASHMQRAVALFEREGMKPVPAPTHHSVLEKQGFSPSDLYPSLRGLRQTQTLVHEGAGLLWAKLRGKA